MKRKHRRLTFIAITLACCSLALLLTMQALKDNIVYFYSPSEMAGESGFVRLGGLVESGSVRKEDGVVRFRVTDFQASVPVEYRGMLPGLFREGQGVIAEGRMSPGGTFAAETILAKHDEYYMPPEVAKALKKSGHWKTQYGLRGQ